MGKIEVCHIGTSHRATDNRIFHNEARSLVKAGYNVTIIGMHPITETISSVKIVPNTLSRGRLDRITLGMCRVLRVALAQKAVVYHLHDPELIFLGVLLKLMGKRVIYDAHENFQEKFRSHPLIPKLFRGSAADIWWLFEKTACRYFDYVITADSVTRAKFPANRSVVLGNFPPLDFGVVEEETKEHDYFTVIYVGGLTEERGIGKALDAIDLIDDIPIRLVLIGETRTPELLCRLTANPKVVHHGRVAWEKLGSYLVGADMGIVLYQPLPSFLYYPGENVVKLFEYMKMGLPVLVSDFPGLRSFIEKIGAGLLVDSSSPEKIAEMIRYFYENPKLRLEMGRKGVNAVETIYNWENEEKKLLQIYGQITQTS